MFRRSTLALFALTLLAAPALLAQLPTLEKVPSEAVTYDAIRVLTHNDGKALYMTLPAEGRQAVWTQHLRSFLAAHPELSDDQRDVVLQGLGLVASGMFSIDRGAPEWSTAVEAPLHRLIARAEAVMPKSLVGEAFMSLSDGWAEHTAIRATNSRLKVTTNVEECNCSPEDSWCSDIGLSCRTGPGWFCFAVPSYNCGPFFTYACTGRCG